MRSSGAQSVTEPLTEGRRRYTVVALSAAPALRRLHGPHVRKCDPCNPYDLDWDLSVTSSHLQLLTILLL